MMLRKEIKYSIKKFIREEKSVKVSSEL